MIKRFFIKVLVSFHFLFSDKLFLQIRYYLEMGKRLNLDCPKTMNEKLQWLKLYNRKPDYTQMVDKIAVKHIVASKLGDSVVIPTLKVWENADDIAFEDLPDKFVLKTSHSGGNTGVIICKDKSKLNLESVKRKLKQSLKSDIYRDYKEWPYKNVCRRIFAETLLETSENSDVVDYKFYCFDGYVDSVLLCVDRQIGDAKFYFFDKNWELKRYNKRGKEAPENFTLPKPKNIERMFEYASVLSKGLPYARIDLYNVDGKIYFGEITFFPASGFDSNRLLEADLHFGAMIKLPHRGF